MGWWQVSGRWVRVRFVVVCLAVVFGLVGCDGGPPNGRVTIRNETDRPVLWVSDGSLDRALELRRSVQSNAVLLPGEEDVVSIPPPAEGEGWCVFDDYWVIVSNADDVADFVAPIDPERVTVSEEILDPCWLADGDTYVIE